MQRCLALAQLGAGLVAPNPMVGAVLVQGSSIIAEGRHEYYGGPHAEVNCLKEIADENLLAQSTLYVNLEPCAHIGKTPPCTDLILQKRIPCVVVGSQDPNPLVAGKGLAQLRTAGVEVTTGVLRAECDFLNRRFLTYHSKQRPYVILKWAQSADGFIGKLYERTAITGAAAQEVSHRWRSEEGAILVGTNTTMIDNPRLTTRWATGKNPLRVVIDKTGKIPANFHLLNDETPTLVFTEKEKTATKNTTFCVIKFEENVLLQILKELYKRQIQSIIVEGGAQLLQSFIEAGLWDEARVFTNQTKLLHDGVRAPIFSASETTQAQIGDDVLQTFLQSTV